MKKAMVISFIIANVMVFASTTFAGTAIASAKLAAQEAYGNLPLYFIQNDGQLDKKVKYYEKGNGHATFFTKDGVYLSLLKQEANKKDITRSVSNKGISSGKDVQSAMVKLIPIGANKTPEIIAENRQEGKVNYLIGNDPNKWQTNIPTYGAVVYKEIYKDIDMKFYGNNRQLEYDIIIKPGADPRRLKLSYEGIEGLKVTKEGDLEITLKNGTLTQKRPYIYQEINGKRIEVDGRFTITPSPLAREGRREGKFSYSFQVASYSKNHPLIIDPVLAYSTYLGGSNEDMGYGIAVDASGNAYITGYTQSTNFPLVSAYQGSLAGTTDAFVTKINPSGSGLVYSTYLGGSSNDEGRGIATDSSGNAYITGITNSTDFPLASAYQGSYAGTTDAFVTKINASGTGIVYSTYLGGSGADTGYSIAADSSGNMYIAGYTTSTDFPLASAIQGSFAGGYDAFVTKINASGASLVYSTYLGGSGGDFSTGFAVDASGNAYIAGHTTSTDFPLASAYQGSLAGSRDVFVTKINPSGTGLVYSTYLGGSGDDNGGVIAVDATGNAYITGVTWSTDFPLASAIQGSFAGGYDAFVTKINPSGTGLVYSTYLGGSGADQGYGVAVDVSGNAYITGVTWSTDFPLASAIQGSFAGYYDAFVTKINPSGSGLVYSTYLGGSGGDTGYGIAADSSGNVFITGYTTSTDFPLASPIQGSNAGYSDAFIIKISPVVSGCINLNGSPVVGSTVTLKQTGGPKKTTTTNDDGCYVFDTAASGKTFTVTINGPVVP